MLAKIDKRPVPPARMRSLVIGLLFVTYFLTYLDRAVMATAIPFIAREFQLSSVKTGSLLSAFFFGYAIMQIPSGILADKIGARRLLVVAVICWSIFTALTGLAHSLALLILVRVLFGLSEGPAPAAVSKTVATWVPRDRIGRSNGIVLAATLLGSAVAPTFVAGVVLHWGWRSAFLSLLVPGLLLAMLLRRVLWRYEAPDALDEPAADPAHAWSSQEWRSTFASPRMRWCIVTTFLSGCANWSLQSWLPTYLLKARGFSVAEMGIFASLPFAAGALGYMSGGFIADHFFAGRRRVLIAACLFFSAILTYGAAVAPTGGVSVAFMTFGFMLLSMALSSLFTLPLLLVPPETTGTAFGIVNTAAQIAGFSSPLLIGEVLDSSNQDFALALYCIVGVIAAAGGAILFIRSEQVAAPRDGASTIAQAVEGTAA